MPDDESTAEHAVGNWRHDREDPLPIGPVHRVGAYKLIEEIGRGGMGTVYAARGDDSDTVVAVKLISGHGLADPKFRQRFLREARTAAAMSHPNIARLHGVFDDGQLLYIVMDYIPGGTLRTRINQQRVRDLRWVIRIAKQIAQGLAAAHQAGVIHRDIKPSNILLDSRGEHAWIADFGLAVFELGEDSLTSTGNPLGTPAYMSPEQTRGERLDKRSDLFSLGCLIYAMISGHSPFQATNLMAVLRKIGDFNPPALSARHIQVPPALSAIVDRLLKKDPDARYDCAEDVIAALERCEALLASGSVVDADASTLTVSSGPTARRSLFAVGLVVVISAAALAWRSSRPTTRPPADFPAIPPAASSLGAKINPSPAGVGPAGPARKDRSSEAIRAGRRWTVSANQSADFTSLQQALKAAHAYDVIEVLDQATYEGPFVIDDPYGLEGVQLTSPAGATLTARSSNGRLAVLTIRGTRRVKVTGFRIVGAPKLHTVMLSGNLSGTVLSRLSLQQSADTQWANVLVANECRGTAEEPVTIRECRLDSGRFGLFSGRTDVLEALELSHLLVDGNDFSGPGTHIVLLHSAASVRIEHNIFHHGVGIEFHLEGARRSGPFSVCNNTFFENEGWIQFGPDRGDYRGSVVNNLVVASSGRAGVAEFGPRRALWKVDHNISESPTALGEKEVDGFGLTTPDAGLQSRDPNSPNFLRPKRGGLAASRAAGPPQPDYVGARRPEP